MVGRLQGKVCLITGSGGSMGRAAALLFAREGARIVGCDVHVERARETVAAVEAEGGEMVSLEPCDLTQPDRCAELVALARDRFGGIDVVYNNAAMAYFDWIDRLSIADWRRTLTEELDLVFLLCQQAWPLLIERGGGSIINVGSICAKLGFKSLPAVAHSAAKGGILALTRQLAVEGAPHRIRVNSVSPGVIVTHQTRAHLEIPDYAATMKAKIMLDRFGQPEDVAAAALFLASDESGWITGADLAVDGGMTAW